MITILYDTKSQEIKSKPIKGGYFVYGQKPKLPKNWAELEVVYEGRPTYNSDTHKIERTEGANLSDAKYVYGWDVVSLSAKELALKDWKHTGYIKRIVANKAVTTQASGFFALFQVQGNPIDYDNSTGNVHVYVNEIEPQYQTTFTQMQQGFGVQIEDRPQIISDNV